MGNREWKNHHPDNRIAGMIPFKALLVEGTSGVGKSTLIDALIRRHVGASEARKIRTLVHLAQSHTYGPLARPEDHGTLTVDANLRHVERIVGTVEWLHAGVQEHARPWCFVLIDTLHLTHCVRPGVVKWSDVEPFDRRLAALGCKLLFLRGTPATIWERGIKPRADQQFIQEYAKKFGRTPEEIHHYFAHEQETLAGLFSRSVMPKLLVQNDGAPDNALEEACRFWANDLAENDLAENDLAGREVEHL
jgi:DNA polymerase III delta prime subunit